MVMYPEGDKWTAEVVFGAKDMDNEWQQLLCLQALGVWHLSLQGRSC